LCIYSKPALIKKKRKFSSYTRVEWSSCKVIYEEGLPNIIIYEEMRKFYPKYEEAVIVIYDFATAPF
jgi:hypothetical protein